MTHLYADVISGQLSDETQAHLIALFTDYLKTGEIDLPSRSAYLSRIRNDLLIEAYTELCPITIAEFYRTFKKCRRLTAGVDYDQAELKLKAVHSLCDRFDLKTPLERTLRDIL